MPNLSRRAALCGTASLSVAALALLTRCGTVTSNTTNGVTTITVNVAKINAYAQAASNFAISVLSNPLIAPLIAPYATTIGTVEQLIITDITAFNAAAGGSVSLSFNAGSVPLAVSSVLTDMQTLAADVVKALPNTAVVGTIASDISALQSLISLFEAMIGVAPVGAVAGAAPKMTEAAALAQLGVK